MKVTILHNTGPDHYSGYKYGDPLTVVAEYDVAAVEADIPNVLEDAFTIFNVGDDPAFTRGQPYELAVQYRKRGNRSLSVGDVIWLDTAAYAVDRIGFKNVKIELASIS